MRKIIFLLFFFSAGLVFSQTSYTKITKETPAIKSSDVGLNIGDSKVFSAEKVLAWSIPNLTSREIGEQLLEELTKKLKDVGFNTSNLKFSNNTLFVNVSFEKELPSDNLRIACKDVGFTYLIVGERIKFINSK